MQIFFICFNDCFFLCDFCFFTFKNNEQIYTLTKSKQTNEISKSKHAKCVLLKNKKIKWQKQNLTGLVVLKVTLKLLLK